MKLVLKQAFIKQYAKLSVQQKQKVDVCLLKFQVDPKAPSLKNHMLKGRLKGKRAISAASNLRIIFLEEQGYVTVYLLAVGTHNQVY